MMRSSFIKYTFFIIILFSYENRLHAEELTKVSRDVLIDLETFKQSGIKLREKPIFLREYNELAEKANTLIDVIISCVRKGGMTQKEEQGMDSQIKTINKDIESINLKLKGRENQKKV